MYKEDEMEKLEVLIKRCQKNDHKAFDKLYEKYSPIIYGICLRYTKNEDDAKDLMQDNFLKILEKINEYKFQGSFDGWIRRIAINNTINFLNANKKLYSSEIELEQNNIAYPAVYEDMNVDVLLKAINCLPEKYRTIFNLFAIDGYSHAEITEILNISEVTSRTQVKRAREFILNNLKKEHYERN